MKQIIIRIIPYLLLIGYYFTHIVLNNFSSNCFVCTVVGLWIVLMAGGDVTVHYIQSKKPIQV